MPNPAGRCSSCEPEFTPAAKIEKVCFGCAISAVGTDNTRATRTRTLRMSSSWRDGSEAPTEADRAVQCLAECPLVARHHLGVEAKAERAMKLPHHAAVQVERRGAVDQPHPRAGVRLPGAVGEEMI